MKKILLILLRIILFVPYILFIALFALFFGLVALIDIAFNRSFMDTFTITIAGKDVE